MKILVHERENDYAAIIEGTGYFGEGSTIYEAVGALVCVAVGGLANEKIGNASAWQLATTPLGNITLDIQSTERSTAPWMPIKPKNQSIPPAVATKEKTHCHLTK